MVPVLTALLHAGAWAASDAAQPVPAIASQPLPAALAAFAQDTHIQLIYLSQLARDKVSPGAPAGLSAQAALTQLLAGTGLTFTFLNDRTVKIFASPHVASSRQRVASEPAVISADALAEVLVTATKRAQALDRVPMSVSVLSADDIDTSGVREIGDIAALTPGLQFDFNSQFGPELLTDVVIRGISTTNGGPLVGIYMDDVPIQASLNVFRNAYPLTFDLDRVEVLRGPQGSLFGADAPSGAIRFVPKTPSVTEFGGLVRSDLEFTRGGNPSWEGGAAVGGPLVQGELGGRISAWYRQEGGYIDRADPFTGTVVDSGANRSSSEVLRGALLFEPTDALHITPSLAYQDVDLHDTQAFYTYLSDPAHNSLRNGKLLRQPHDDAFTLATLKVEQDFAATMLTGITSYFDRRSMAINDVTNGACLSYFGTCGNPLGPAFPTSYAQGVASRLQQHQSAFTQEVRLASARPEARWRWLVGAFYQRGHQDGSVDTYAVTAPDVAGIYSSKLFYGMQLSVFGQAEFEFAPRWRAGVGTRVGWQRGDSTDYEGGFANLGVAPFAHGVGHYQAQPSTPRVDVSFQMDANDLLYAALSKGARGAGSNSAAQCGTSSVPATFTSDAIWNYELGLKSALWQHRLQLASSVYYIRWDSIQEPVSDACGHGYTANLGLATSTGFDLSATALLSTRWHVALALGLTDVHYTRTVLNGNGQSVVDRGSALGELPAVTPPWNGTLSTRYQYPLGRAVIGYISVEDVFTSHNPGPFTALDPNSVNYSAGLRADPATNRLNLRAGMTRGGWELRLSVENAFDSLPTLQRNSDAAGSALYYAYTLRPRTVGLASDWRF